MNEVGMRYRCIEMTGYFSRVLEEDEFTITREQRLSVSA